MSIDEAIAHALEVAESNEKRLDKEGNPYYEKCEKCAAEHRQLAEWLKELKQLRECGKTAITRAENDEILDEAWHLLMSVTEEDGVTTEQANGMLKLMTFFFYKYHGLKKKPEWVENVEARIEESASRHTAGKK